ncbi:hypothetical protein IJ103_01955 [Candidatus Saccharibacteria bacterium]|nr:hypothetical protein [Candidatus Saccharibacteria bacterium]
MKKKLLALALILGLMMPVAIPSGEASAAAVENYDQGCSEEAAFLGLRPWYYGLTVKKNNKCEVGSPIKSEGADGIAKFIWQIVLNVLIDLFIVAGVVSVGFLIYGGYLYLRSGGDPNFAAKGKKTITAALVGLAIVTFANVISQLISTVLSAAAPEGAVDGNTIQTILNWVYAIMGLVAVVGIIFGAVVWTTSQGDPTKVKKGRDAILYAVIGLVVVLLAVAITNLVAGIGSAPSEGADASGQSSVQEGGE